jgi:hypothetical protein
MNSADDTDRTPVEGEDVHQGARGLDAFSVQQGPAVVGEGGAAPGANPDAPDAPGPTPAELPPDVPTPARVAAQRWAVRGAALASRVAARHRGEEPFVPMPAGWTMLSRVVSGLPPHRAPSEPEDAPHGWRPGVYFVTAGTGAGKSQFAMECAFAAARADVPAGVIGLELDDLGLYARGASVVCGDTDDTRGTPWERTSWGSFYNGRVAGVPDGVQAELARLPLYPIEPDAHAWPARHIDAFVASMRDAENARRASEGRAPLGAESPVFVVLDFLQLVGRDPENPRAELRERIGEAAYRARMVARNMHAVVLVLSSIPRASYGATLVDPAERESIEDGTKKVKATTSAATARDGMDLVGIGKESGDVEFSADGVLVLCPHKHPRGVPRERWGNVDVCVAKLRAGRADLFIPMQFDGTRFREAPPPPLRRREGAPAPAEDPRCPPERDDNLDNPADEPDTVPAEKPAPRRGGRRKGKTPAATSTPAEPAAPDTSPDHPAETDP